MLWFFVAAIGYLLLAVVGILDKIILSKKVANPAVYAFYSTIFLLPLLLAIFFGVDNLAGRDWVIGIGSGLAFGFGLWTMYIALQKGESSHINPFIGAVVALVVYIISSSFLNENLTGRQLLGLAILIVATALFSAEKSREHSGFHVGFAWAILSGIFFAVSHTTAKYIYGIYPFFTTLVWTKGSVGLVGIFLLSLPVVRSALRSNKKPRSSADKKKNFLVLVLGDKALSIIGTVMVQYAIALGSVALVNALAGLQYAFLFILVFALTKIAPKFFKEYFTRREIVSETIAVALMLLGTALVAWG
ncbi:MAG: DMT family transporter [Patescibacteria group bacterium]